MPLSLTNSNDIFANSVSLSAEDSVDNILDLFLKKTDAIQQIVGSHQRRCAPYRNQPRESTMIASSTDTITGMLNNRSKLN